jgi:hypothetical protein
LDLFTFTFISLEKIKIKKWQKIGLKNFIVTQNRASHFSKILDDNFSSTDDEKLVLFKDGNADFRCWSTGRENCDGYSATITLQKRYDVIAMLLGLVWGYDEDLITIDIPVPKLEPFIFAVANTDYKEKYEDIVNILN